MKHRIPLAAASLAVLGSVVVSAPALGKTSPDHDGDHRPCVVDSEFNRVDTGDSKTWVREVFDTRGHEVSPTAANQLYNDLDYYGVDLPRLRRQYREVRVYAVCLDGGLRSGTVTAVFDTRGHKLAVAEMETTGTEGRQSVGMIELPPVPVPETPDPESPLCSRCG